MKILAAILAGGLLLAAPAAQEKEIRSSIGMKLVRIEPGQFVMGSGEAPPATREAWHDRDWDEAPAHAVKITKAFYIGATEVTHAQFEQFDPEHRQWRGKGGTGKGDDEPVTHVTWEQAANFCAWLSKKEGKPYRLPTEAEWEYACRAGTTTAFSTGDAITPEQANLGVAPEGKKKIATVPVGRYPPNGWGLFDLHGNVSEWCLDWHGPYPAGEQTDPVGPAEGHARVTRGWSYLSSSNPKNAARYARSANRSGHLPEDANRCTGFRVVLGEKPSTAPWPVPPPPRGSGEAPRTSPDPSRPFFLDYSKAGKAAVVPKDAWGPLYAAWNHFSTVCVCPNGDVLAVWYSTVSEEGRECAQAATRLRSGSDRWDPPSPFFGVPDVNTHAPVLLSDGKRLFHFFTQSLSGWDDAAVGLRVSDDSGFTWSKPRLILTREDPMRMSQPCSAFVARDGTLVLACDGDFGHRDERVLTSSDGGATWKVGQGDLKKAAGKVAIHPAVVQRQDGAILAFLRGPDPMPAFASKDRGESWEPVATPFPGISVGQKAAALKLAGGALLLAAFDNKKKLVGGGSYAALSFDDGATWSHVRKVEGPGGYLSLAQAPDGVIYLVGPRGSQISCIAFNEAWLKEGKPIEK